VLDIIARKLFCGEKKNGEWLQVTECSARRRKEGGCGWVSLTDSQKKSFFLFFFFSFFFFLSSIRFEVPRHTADLQRTTVQTKCD
jgi:hypothetical protein